MAVDAVQNIYHARSMHLYTEQVDILSEGVRRNRVGLKLCLPIPPCNSRRAKQLTG